MFDSIKMEVRIDELGLPKLTRDQMNLLLERLGQIPGYISTADLRVVVRLYCREVGCKLEEIYV